MFDAFGDIGSGFFDFIGGGAFDGIAGGFGRAASGLGESGAAEGMGSTVWRWLTMASDMGWNAAGLDAGISAVKNLFGATDLGKTPENVEHVKKAVLAHGIIAQQLEANAGHSEGMKQTFEDYLASGHDLPQEAVLKDAYRKLASVLHQDKSGNEVRNVEKDAFFNEVSRAYKHLGKPEVREAYREAMESNPEGVKKLFDELKGVEWDKMHELNFERVLIEGPGGTPPAELTGMSKWVAELSPAKKSGLVFGAVGAVVVGGYVAAKVMEKRSQKKKESAAQAEEPASHVQRVRENQPGAAASLG